MAEANILFSKEGSKKQNNGDKIEFALSVILYADKTVQIADTTDIDDKSFNIDYNLAYRMVCDAKNQLELIRLSMYKQEETDFLQKLMDSPDIEDEEDDE